jgi:hypothetical protein
VHAMKSYGSAAVQLHSFLASALGGGEGSTPHACRFTPGGRVTRVLCVGAWIGPSAYLDALDKK